MVTKFPGWNFYFATGGASHSPPVVCCNALGAGNTLFISERRRPLSRSNVSVMVNHCTEAAGLSDLHVHCHMLRHACGYDLANRGFDTRGIQGYLGHQNIQHTVRYTALSPNRFANYY